MSIQVFVSRRSNPANAISHVSLPASDLSGRISRLLGLNEHIELDVHPDRIIRAIYRAREIGRALDELDALYDLADKAREVGHLLDWFASIVDNQRVVILRISQYEIGEPSTSWSASNLEDVFADIGLEYTRSGTIHPGTLLAKCDHAIARGSMWLDRIRSLRSIADWALVRGRHVAWC